jgi:hypothetical protein
MPLKGELKLIVNIQKIIENGSCPSGKKKNRCNPPISVHKR